MDKSKIMLFIDNDIATNVKSYFTEKGYPTSLRPDAKSAYAELREGGALRNIDVLIVHKDLGAISRDWSLTSDGVCEYVHEHYPWIRIGIVSGEFPDGTRHVEGMEADFYFSYIGLTSEWMKEQLDKGTKTQDEMKQHKLEISPEGEGFVPWPEEEDHEGRLASL